MAVSNRGRRARLLVLAVAVAAIIWSFTPKKPATSGPVRAAADRKPIADFALPVIGGGEWSMARHRGEVLLVNFWATWCPPCRRETPELVDLHKRYASRGFSVVGISMDDDPATAVPDFARRYHVAYPLLAPTESFDLANQVESLPTSILLDREGRIARTYLGAVTSDMLSEDVEALLAERAPAPTAGLR